MSNTVMDAIADAMASTSMPGRVCVSLRMYEGIFQCAESASARGRVRYDNQDASPASKSRAPTADVKVEGADGFAGPAPAPAPAPPGAAGHEAASAAPGTTAVKDSVSTERNRESQNDTRPQ